MTAGVEREGTDRACAADEAVEAAAKALWTIGNDRIGFREWETVAEHYRVEAKAALTAALAVVLRSAEEAYNLLAKGAAR